MKTVETSKRETNWLHYSVGRKPTASYSPYSTTPDRTITKTANKYSFVVVWQLDCVGEES